MVSKRVQTLLEQLRAQGIRDEHVLDALAQVPREKFVDEAFEHKAWENVALPIGQGQTISQPYMVAAVKARSSTWRRVYYRYRRSRALCASGKGGTGLRLGIFQGY